MKKVLVFAGTTEGRELAEIFDRSNIACHVCVATEYGSQMLKTTDNITVHEGRLDEMAMRKLISDIGCDIVVDATHPYAVMVTEQIKNSIEGLGVDYIRLIRENDAHVEDNNAHFYDDICQCAKELAKTEGRLLLTTGSKQLKEFTAVEELKKRLIARVIPGIESLKLCYDAGLEGNQIIAMQGPFSQAMNESIIKEYDIRHLVTKESGVTGGTDAKYAAAMKLGAKLHIIKRPEENENPGKNVMSLKGTVDYLESLLGIIFKRGKIKLTLAGIGPGNQCMLTKEVEDAIAQAEVIFGAERMIEGIYCKAVKYPYYRKDDILPVLKKMSEERYTDARAVILFSGDTGFYSGSSKMYEAVSDDDTFEVKVLPGISSISVLSARLGISWQDGNIISLHGVSKEQWIPKLLDSVKHNEKTFFITSGIEDIKEIGSLLEKDNDNYKICLGYQISYPEEQIIMCSPEQCLELIEEGLYAGVIIADKVENRYLVPALNDEFFIRDKVPMTKEEIRKLSICQMEIKENDIVYDIGSGSGSIAVQIGALSDSVKVFALECNPEAISLISKNVQKVSLHNIEIIETMAPAGLEKLPVANKAFIGGSKGYLRDILLKLYDINSSMRVVMNAVSMESICEMNRILEELSICNLSIEQVSVSKAKKLGDYHMLSANNPVFIFSFDFCDRK